MAQEVELSSVDITTDINGWDAMKLSDNKSKVMRLLGVMCEVWSMEYGVMCDIEVEVEEVEEVKDIFVTDRPIVRPTVRMPSHFSK